MAWFITTEGSSMLNTDASIVIGVDSRNSGNAAVVARGAFGQVDLAFGTLAQMNAKLATMKTNMGATTL